MDSFLGTFNFSLPSFLLICTFAQITQHMSQEISKRYAQRGVSAAKEDVHNAIKNVDKGLFQRRFVKLFPIILRVMRLCLIMLQMVQGQNLLWPILYWKETGDLSVWKMG